MNGWVPLGRGWLGDMYRVQEGNQDLRKYEVQAISSSLRKDLRLRSSFSKVIDHPNLPGVQELDQVSFVTPYRSGVSVLQLIQENAFQDERLLLHFLEQLLLLFSLAHTKGWIHGDLHPGLIYIMKDGDVVIEGFGRKANPSEHPHTGHHRYLHPEPFGSVMGDLYSCGVIALELLLGSHVPLGDILEESHTKKIEGYLHKIRDAHPLCLSFIRSSLQFYPEKRKAASLIFLPKPESKVPEEWLLFCASISHENPNVETTDPMDVIFHTEEEELAQSFFLSMEDITMNELTEEILPQESLHLKTSSSEITNKKESLVLISILVIIIALLILIAVIL